MRILADENIPKPVVDALREAGHEVVWILEQASGSSDADVGARMRADHRVLLTLDKGFSQLLLASSLPRDCGVVLLRVVSSAPTLLARIVVAALEGRDDWAGHFAVIEAGRVRMRPLPRRRGRTRSRREG